jgi:hypothetical protein
MSGRVVSSFSDCAGGDSVVRKICAISVVCVVRGVEQSALAETRKFMGPWHFLEPHVLRDRDVSRGSWRFGRPENVRDKRGMRGKGVGEHPALEKMRVASIASCQVWRGKVCAISAISALIGWRRQLPVGCGGGKCAP